MPELPEGQTVVNTLTARLLGARICAVGLNRQDIVAPLGTDLVAYLTDRTIAAIDRRGKRIVFTLDDGNRFFIHLGMTGRLTIESPDGPVQKHTHLILELDLHDGKARLRPSRSSENGSAGPPLPASREPSPSQNVTELRFRDPRRF